MHFDGKCQAVAELPVCGIFIQPLLGQAVLQAVLNSFLSVHSCGVDIAAVSPHNAVGSKIKLSLTSPMVDLPVMHVLMQFSTGAYDMKNPGLGSPECLILNM